MKNRLVLLFFFSSIFFISFSSKAQSIGDYRSVASGNWSSLATWEIYNGLMWTTPLLAPSSLSGAIAIRNSHTVTVTANTTVDDVTIDVGGTINISTGTLTLDILGLGDLTCNGALQVAGGDLNMNLTNAVSVNGSMLWTDGDLIAGTVNVNNGGTLTLNTAAEKDLQSSTINVNMGGIMNWDDGNINLNI